MTYNYSDISLQEYPGEVSLVLYTGKCNLKCPWCYNEILHNKTPLSYKQMKDAINEHIDFITSVTFTGGEPLYNPFLNKALKYASDCGLKTKLNTNGLVPDDVRGNRYLPYVNHLNISLKGLPSDYKSIINTSSEWPCIPRTDVLEYSFVYIPALWPQKKLDDFYLFLKEKISFDWTTMFSDRWSRPDIFTISQVRTGNCIDSQYNSCKVPTQEECIKIAKMFQDIPAKKSIVETREFGKIIV